MTWCVKMHWAPGSRMPRWAMSYEQLTGKKRRAEFSTEQDATECAKVLISIITASTFKGLEVKEVQHEHSTASNRSGS